MIDIHSQHQNLLLADNRFQMQVIDILAGNKILLKDYQKQFKTYKSLEKSLQELKDSSKRNKEEEDYLRFQYESLKEAQFIDREQEELEAEQETLNHAEDIKSGLYKTYLLLSDDEKGVVSSLKEGVATLQALQKVYAKSETILQRFETAYIDLKDLSVELERNAGDIEFNPERLTEINTRLDLIYSLQKKHKVSTIAELLTIRDELEQKLQNIDSSDEHIEVLEKEVQASYDKVLNLAKQLSNRRIKAIPDIQKQLVDKVSFLGIPNIRFECRITAKDQPDMSGVDELAFLFSANKSAPLQPVANIASGGEISRLMLCLKSMIAGATALPTIIFDEIDTGVSGEIADKMGQIMQDFGQKMQVMAITHLPQIAAKGKSHYKVYKADNSDVTTTHLDRLSDNQRLEEIARMLSGATLTDAAMQNAKVMLGL